MNHSAQILGTIVDLIASGSGVDETTTGRESTKSWDEGLQVVVRKTREGAVVALVLNSDVDDLLTTEQLEYLDAEGLLPDGFDTRRTRLGGVVKSCLTIDMDKLRIKAKDHDRAQSKLIILERRVKELEKELRNARADNAGEEAMAQFMDKLADTVVSRKGAKQVKIPTRSDNKERTLGGVPTLLCSDWHWGEVVDPAQVEHLNEFNLDIAKNRAQRIFGSTIDLLTTHMGGERYEGMVCSLAGDMLSGNIHEELRETNEEEILEAVLSLHDTLHAGITALGNEFGNVYLPCVVGNHGRIDRKPTAKNKVVNNFDWLLYKMLERTFKAHGASNIVFDISESADMRFDIYGTRYLLTHGDQIKGGAGVGGIWPSMMKTDQRKRKRHQLVGGGYDYLVCGHFHRYGTIEGIIVNGSLKGYDEWVYSMNFDNEAPKQALWITHPQYGITKHIPVYGDEQHERIKGLQPIASYRRNAA